MSRDEDAEQLRRAVSAVVRAMGLPRPDTTTSGQPITATEAHALNQLHDRGSLTQRQLAAALGLQQSTISRLVDQLTEKDLAWRSPNPDDRRSVRVALTDNGAVSAKRLVRARRDVFADLLERLDPSDRPTVVDGLARLEEAARGLT